MLLSSDCLFPASARNLASTLRTSCTDSSLNTSSGSTPAQSLLARVAEAEEVARPAPVVEPLDRPRASSRFARRA